MSSTILINGQPAAGGLTNGEISLCKYLNTDVVTDLNVNTSTSFVTIIPIFGTASITSDEFIVTGNQVTVQFNGLISFHVHLNLSIVQANRQIQVSLRKNGNPIGSPCSQGAKISSTNDVSLVMCEYIECAVGDIFTLGARQNGLTGTVTMAGVGKSIIEMLRLS